MTNTPRISTRDDGFTDVVANGTRFVIFPPRNGGWFVTAHNEEWASVPVGNFPSLGDAINRTLQPFDFPVRKAQ